MPWSTETVDIGRLGQYPSVVDFDGNPTILYAGRGNGSIKIANQVSGIWKTSTINQSINGFIESIDAVGNLNTNMSVVYIDRQRQSIATATSSIVYGVYDGTRWVFEIITSDSFASKFFHNTRMERAPSGDVIGWTERTGGDPTLNILIAERKTGSLWIPRAVGATNARTSWDMAIVGTELAVAYFDIVDRSIKFVQRSAGIWSSPATVASFSGNQSVAVLSLTSIEGIAHIAYQVNFGNVALPGSQRRATNESGAWVEDIVEQPIVPSGFTDRATSISQIGFPAIAYHIKNRNNALMYARFVDDPVYGLDSWALEEVGINLAMPSLRFIGTTGYIAAYQIKTQVLVFATEVL